MPVTIYHNPTCGTSRNVLAMIRQSGEEPTVMWPETPAGVLGVRREFLPAGRAGNRTRYRSSISC